MIEETIDGYREAIPTPLGNMYLFVGEKDLMAFLAEENNPVQAEPRALTECIMRIASKGMAGTLTLEDVAEQMEKSGAGRSPTLLEIAARIRTVLNRKNEKE